MLNGVCFQKMGIGTDISFAEFFSRRGGDGMQALDAYLRGSVKDNDSFESSSPVLDALVDSMCSAIGSFTNMHQLAKDVGAKLGASTSDHTIRISAQILCGRSRRTTL